MKNINVVAERTTILQLLGDVIYGKKCCVDDDHVDWALVQIDMMANSHPMATTFMRYIKDVWRPKYHYGVLGLDGYLMQVKTQMRPLNPIIPT